LTSGPETVNVRAVLSITPLFRSSPCAVDLDLVDWGLIGFEIVVNNITMDSEGNLFGWWEAGEDDLVSINKATGSAVRVGESGRDTWTGSLDFDNSGDLYVNSILPPGRLDR
jgi:hypothetical protein